MNATIALPENAALVGLKEFRLKEFLIFRVDEFEGHPELSDDSSLEGEGIRYARLMARPEPGEGIHYEVRASVSGALLYSTEDPDDDSDENSDDENEETTWTTTDSIPIATS